MVRLTGKTYKELMKGNLNGSTTKYPSYSEGTAYPNPLSSMIINPTQLETKAVIYIYIYILCIHILHVVFAALTSSDRSITKSHEKQA